jgi:hypothetical protein
MHCHLQAHRWLCIRHDPPCRQQMPVQCSTCSAWRKGLLQLLPCRSVQEGLHWQVHRLPSWQLPGPGWKHQLQKMPSWHLLLLWILHPQCMSGRLLQRQGRLQRVQGMPRQHVQHQGGGRHFLHPLPQVHSGSQGQQRVLSALLEVATLRSSQPACCVYPLPQEQRRVR